MVGYMANPYSLSDDWFQTAGWNDLLYDNQILEVKSVGLFDLVDMAPQESVVGCYVTPSESSTTFLNSCPFKGVSQETLVLSHSITPVWQGLRVSTMATDSTHHHCSSLLTPLQR